MHPIKRIRDPFVAIANKPLESYGETKGHLESRRPQLKQDLLQVISWKKDGSYATKEDCNKFVQNIGDFDLTLFYIFLSGANKELNAEKWTQDWRNSIKIFVRSKSIIRGLYTHLKVLSSINPSLLSKHRFFFACSVYSWGAFWKHSVELAFCLT